MLKKILLLWLLGTVSALAQTGAVQGHSFVGGTPSVTSGLKSANYLDGIIPHATITVYFTGTTNLVPGSQIFSNSTGTVLGNPFTSNDISSLNPGGWLFFAAQGQGYDVVGSGGLSPNTYPSPVTLCTDCFAGGSGGSASFLAYVNGTPLITLGSANFVNSPSILFTNPTGNQIQATAVNAGGCTGTLSSDNTSTDCGYQNRVGDTSSTPANTQTFGTELLTNSSESQVVAAGSGAGANSTLTDAVIEGDTEGAYLSGTGLVAVGTGELQGTSGHLCSISKVVSLGYTNAYQCSDASFTDVNAIGDNNLNLAHPSGYSLNDVHLFGDENFIGMPNGAQSYTEILAAGFNNVDDLKTSTEVIALGDSSVTGAIRATGSAVTDVIGIGDAAADGISDGSLDVIAIGDGSGDVGSDATGSQIEEVAIGTDAATNATGQDIIAIGDLPLTGLNGISSTYNTGNDIIAIGDTPLACNHTGFDNVAIGDHAGSIGFTGTVCGNSNETGSHNVWIGDTAGPNTATQLSNTIAIGYQAYNTASNQIVLGNSSTTQAIINGTIQTPALLSAPCVGTDSSGNLISNPGCTGGGSFSYPSGTGIVQVTGGSAWGTTLGVGTSANNIPQLDGGGLLLPAVLPLATAAAFGAVEVDNVTITASGGVISAVAGGAPAFSTVTAGTNAHALLMGTGGSLGVSGSGTIAATTAVNLASYPTLCSAGQFSQGLSSGSNNCATPSGSGISLTTTGTSGLATFSGSTLNVPHYAGSGTNADITSLTGLGLTGYVIGNGPSNPLTASTTIPGSVISSNISYAATNLYGSPTLPSTVSGVTSTPSGSGDTHVATKGDVYNATTGAGIPRKLCSGTLTLSGTLASATTATVGTATCTGLTATNGWVIVTINDNIFTYGGFIPSTNGVLSLAIQPTTNTININAENNTAVSQTLGAVPVSYMVLQ